MILWAVPAACAALTALTLILTLAWALWPTHRTETSK